GIVIYDHLHGGIHAQVGDALQPVGASGQWMPSGPAGQMRGTELSIHVDEVRSRDMPGHPGAPAGGRVLQGKATVEQTHLALLQQIGDGSDRDQGLHCVCLLAQEECTGTFSGFAVNLSARLTLTGERGLQGENIDEYYLAQTADT